MFMPMKLMKAIPINPVIMNAIPSPLKGAGIAEYLSFSLIAAMATIARSQPKPDPKPKTVASMKSYSRATINRDPPRIEQFTVIKGRNIPNEI